MPTATLDVGPNGEVGVAWTSGHEDEEMDAYFAESTNEGISFGTNYRINPDSGGIQQLPEIAYDGSGRAHLFYEDTPHGQWDADVMYTFTDDGGETLSDPVRVNDDPPSAGNPQEAISAAGLAGEGILAIWMDMRDGFDENLFFARTHDPMGVCGASAIDAPLAPLLFFESLSFRASSAEVFDITGRCRRSFPACGDAERTRLWNGRDDRGRRLAPGRYFLKLHTGTGVCTRPVTFVR